MMIVAAQAMAAAAKESDAVIPVQPAPIASPLPYAISLSSVRAALARALPDVAVHFGENATSMLDTVLVAANVGGVDRDFTADTDGVGNPSLGDHSTSRSGCYISGGGGGGYG